MYTFFLPYTSILSHRVHFLPPLCPILVYHFKSSKNFRFPHPPIPPLPHSLSHLSPPIFLSIVLPMPFFHQIAVSKVRPRKTFFIFFKNFFRPKLSFFTIFKTFSRPNADRVIPFHGEKARKTDNLHNRNSRKITLIWLKSPSQKYLEKNIQKNRKNFKKGVDFLKGVCYTT